MVYKLSQVATTDPHNRSDSVNDVYYVYSILQIIASLLTETNPVSELSEGIDEGNGSLMLSNVEPSN